MQANQGVTSVTCAGVMTSRDLSYANETERREGEASERSLTTPAEP